MIMCEKWRERDEKNRTPKKREIETHTASSSHCVTKKEIGRIMQGERGRERGEGAMDNNKTLLSDYLEDFEELETPIESLKHIDNFCVPMT